MKKQDLLKVLGTNIKKHRVRLNWSQAVLAEKIDISITFLSSIERGAKWLSPVTVIKLAEAFHIDSYELFKPENIFPDACQDVLGQYAEDIHFAVDSIRGKYLKQLGRR
ncbi:transcriptional regulator XRE family [Candidatus Termititenax persephonae]|uniref:Transcriptional regulator XRE family n=1 Tax=Candidatus Termititenax persephonae TaxID=2218525 RepID=A0A388TIZ9_9BACT|nr:transcriptional regulator XRE family [Candidatus Termititenax persephonae]